MYQRVKSTLVNLQTPKSKDTFKIDLLKDLQIPK